MLEGSVSINGRELETMLAFRSPTEDIENDLFGKPVSTKSRDLEKGLYSPSLREPLRHRDLAALRLQKVYKSFRTRRQLADCAVLAEQRWLVSFNISYLQVIIYRPIRAARPQGPGTIIDLSTTTKTSKGFFLFHLYIIFLFCICVKWSNISIIMG